MSLTKTVEVFCDRCPVWVHGSTNGSAMEARIRAKRAGWVRRNVGGKMLDLCPDCAAGNGSSQSSSDAT